MSQSESKDRFAKISESKTGETVAPVPLVKHTVTVPPNQTFRHELIYRYATFDPNVTSAEIGQRILQELPDDFRIRMKLVSAGTFNEVLVLKRSKEQVMNAELSPDTIMETDDDLPKQDVIDGVDPANIDPFPGVANEDLSPEQRVLRENARKTRVWSQATQ